MGWGGGRGMGRRAWDEEEGMGAWDEEGMGAWDEEGMG